MTTPIPLPDLPPDAQLRSGTAARLAGLPATTLRVWERRYAVVAAPKTDSGQRLYSVADVRRLALLRQLTSQGHAIGTIATLPLPALQGLATATASRAAAGDPPTPRLAVVGAGLAARLADARPAASLTVHADLPAALAALASAPGHLVVEVPALAPPLAGPLVGAVRAAGVRGVTVVYRFGPASALAALRKAGAALLREPVAPRTLARRLAVAAAQGVPPGPPAAPLPRRFSDAELARLAQRPGSLLCECPRHLAEIVAQLVAFEHYCTDCGQAQPGDAELHRRLHALAAESRARFEEALAELAAAEGLLPADG